MPSERYEQGLAIRKAVQGEEYVEKALRSNDDFSWPMEQLSTEYCWGTIWARSDLDRKTRSLLNLAILTALNRTSQLPVHIRGALRNGCTKEEIREVLLQTAVYCGIPAAVDSFRIAREVLNE